MEIYLKLFEVIFPVFFVVGIGYYLGKKNPKIDTTFITNFGANIGSPAIVFYSVTTTGLTFGVFTNYFIYYDTNVRRYILCASVCTKKIIFFKKYIFI